MSGSYISVGKMPCASGCTCSGSSGTSTSDGSDSIFNGNSMNSPDAGSDASSMGGMLPQLIQIIGMIVSALSSMMGNSSSQSNPESGMTDDSGGATPTSDTGGTTPSDSQISSPSSTGESSLGSQTGAATTQPASTANGQGYTAKATSYYPSNDPIEGGFVDKEGKPLHTLQDYLAGKAPYVSVAMDPNSFQYGQNLRIPELEQKYGRQIPFKVVDDGPDFQGKGTSRIDICSANESTSYDDSLNGNLTLIPVS